MRSRGAHCLQDHHMYVHASKVRTYNHTKQICTGNMQIKQPTNTTDFGTDLCILEVVSPQRSDLVLATHVPYCKRDILVLHCLHIEPYT